MHVPLVSPGGVPSNRVRRSSVRDSHGAVVEDLLAGIDPLLGSGSAQDRASGYKVKLQEVILEKSELYECIRCVFSWFEPWRKLLLLRYCSGLAAFGN